MHQNRQSSGFTLIELSMVLIIIGLIAGGIIIGKSLIHNAELQSIISDIDRFKKAAVLFREKYKELPGDFSNATSIWGQDLFGCATSTVAKVKTCNGNGDGFIVDSATMTPVQAAGLNNLPETVRAWQHLANAGLISGGYSGAYPSVTTRQSAGISTPASKLTPNTFDIFYVPRGAYTGAFNANYQHIIVYGSPTQTTLLTSPSTPGLNTVDASALDQKIDDGKPGTGNVLSFTPDLLSNQNCATSNNAATAEYTKTNTTQLRCALIFITGF